MRKQKGIKIFAKGSKPFSAIYRLKYYEKFAGKKSIKVGSRDSECSK